MIGRSHTGCSVEIAKESTAVLYVESVSQGVVDSLNFMPIISFQWQREVRPFGVISNCSVDLATCASLLSSFISLQTEALSATLCSWDQILSHQTPHTEIPNRETTSYLAG